MIYDTLAEPLPLAARTDVPGVRFVVTCGEVPQQNWTLASNAAAEGLDLSISGSLNGRNVGEKSIVLFIIFQYLYLYQGLNGTFLANETTRTIAILCASVAD